MKKGVSMLNPYAASYIPLSKREERTQKQVEKSSSDSGVSGSSSQHPNGLTGKLAINEEFDILEFLKTSFPRMSDESLNEVYQASKGDLDATVDMLSHLEFDDFESPENLPDTLDIGDVSELGSVAECSSVKQKNVVGEASASLSGSPASVPVNVT
ncbi:polyadenylate-binding protein-interacting protein 6-like [Mercurialis annua]|uniref:polyadenylate-binding protein-interacting protein 6-like n=1 Tax=Mercurialis annua TaxID=3986 RepID=UPI00215FF7EB|nr:polyadenylate-binding protein-interacting protein 6-like [Mercurialis annua]